MVLKIHEVKWKEGDYMEYDDTVFEFVSYNLETDTPYLFVCVIPSKPTCGWAKYETDAFYPNTEVEVLSPESKLMLKILTLKF